MKQLKFISKGLFALMAIALLLGTASCGKSEIRKNISGTWNLESITENGVNFYTSIGATISGTFNFSEMSRKENRQGQGTLTKSFNISHDGTTQSWTEAVNYHVIDNERIFHLDDEYLIDLSANSMVLTSTNDAFEVIKITLSR